MQLEQAYGVVLNYSDICYIQTCLQSIERRKLPFLSSCYGSIFSQYHVIYSDRNHQIIYPKRVKIYFLTPWYRKGVNLSLACHQFANIELYISHNQYLMCVMLWVLYWAPVTFFLDRQSIFPYKACEKLSQPFSSSISSDNHLAVVKGLGCKNDIYSSATFTLLYLGVMCYTFQKLFQQLSSQRIINVRIRKGFGF